MFPLNCYCYLQWVFAIGDTCAHYLPIVFLLQDQILCCCGILGVESAIRISQIPLVETTDFHLRSANGRYSGRLKWGSGGGEAPLYFPIPASII